MRNQQAKFIALGGMLAALAVVIMCLGGLIPIATYVCPVLCMTLLCFVLQLCGERIGWAWYGAVAVLCLLLGPDKEAAVIFLFLGYYPMLKPRLDGIKLGWILKLVYFNGTLMLAYTVLIYAFGMGQLLAEFQELGKVMTAMTLLLGNITLFLLDKVLVRLRKLAFGVRNIGA